MSTALLSASRIKTLESCAWKYWCNYHLYLPSESNDGARRGTVCHLVLELLLKKRHKKHFTSITKDDTLTPAIKKLVLKLLKRENATNLDENYFLCEEMIGVGLKNDFFGKGGKIESPELEFLLENEEPFYKAKGFIDKPIKYANKVSIVDYKTSKSKFTEGELESNLQAMTYALAAKRTLWPKIKKVSVSFLFLRFPDDPVQTIEFNSDQLNGFEYYLSHIYKIINNFSEKDANSNFAAHQPMPKKAEGFCGPLNCGFAKYPGHKKKNGDPMWHCDYKFPYDYYAVVDEDGVILKTAFTKEPLKARVNKNCKIIKKHYDGCPVHTVQEDDFNF